MLAQYLSVYTDCPLRTVIATLLMNWHNVLRAINMASSGSITIWRGELGADADLQ